MLRRFVPEDRDGFVEMNRDPGVRKYFPGLLTPEESLGEMTRIEQHWDTHGFGPWALDVRGDFAGFLGLKWVPPDMPFAPAVERQPAARGGNVGLFSLHRTWKRSRLPEEHRHGNWHWDTRVGNIYASGFTYAMTLAVL